MTPTPPSASSAALTPAAPRPTPHPPASTTDDSPPVPGLAQVWGDVVALRDLAYAIVLGGAISLAAYLGATAVFARWVDDPSLARAYGMLVGIAGCIVAGAVCAMLFKPKREVFEEMQDSAWHDKVLDQLALEHGGLGRLEDLPPATAQELKDLGLYDVFAARTQATSPANRRAES